jgi:hypothetical protein
MGNGVELLVFAGIANGVWGDEKGHKDTLHAGGKNGGAPSWIHKMEVIITRLLSVIARPAVRH